MCVQSVDTYTECVYNFDYLRICPPCTKMFKLVLSWLASPTAGSACFPVCSSFACHSSPLPVILSPPQSLHSVLHPSHISFQVLLNFYTSESSAVLIAFSRDQLPMCCRAIKNNRQTNYTAVEKNRFFSLKDKVSVYKKESVRWQKEHEK